MDIPVPSYPFYEGVTGLFEWVNGNWGDREAFVRRLPIVNPQGYAYRQFPADATVSVKVACFAWTGHAALSGVFWVHPRFRPSDLLKDVFIQCYLDVRAQMQGSHYRFYPDPEFNCPLFPWHYLFFRRTGPGNLYTFRNDEILSLTVGEMNFRAEDTLVMACYTADYKYMIRDMVAHPRLEMPLRGVDPSNGIPTCQYYSTSEDLRFFTDICPTLDWRGEVVTLTGWIWCAYEWSHVWKNYGGNLRRPNWEPDFDDERLFIPAHRVPLILPRNFRHRIPSGDSEGSMERGFSEDQLLANSTQLQDRIVADTDSEDGEQ